MKEISLQRLLFEEPEHGSEALFGKYMFDDQRKDIRKNEKEEPTAEILKTEEIDNPQLGNL